MPTAPTPITPYATPPSSSDPANFDARADAKVAQDVVFVGEANALADNVYDNAVEAAGSATAAAGSANDALAERIGAEAARDAAVLNAQAAGSSAGATIWISGQVVAEGVSRWSPQDARVYRRRVAGGGTTDPAADPTNWALVSPNGLQLIPVAGTTHVAAPGGRYVLKNAAATTLTAPPSPQAGDEFGYKTANDRLDNEIDWNGANHEGLSDATTTLNGSRRGWGHFVYIDSAIGWGAIG